MHHLLKILSDAPSKDPILCVGDVMLDTFYYGNTSRISPEAPIPVLRVERELLALGGASNVVNNLHALSMPSALVGILGNDAEGKRVQKLLKERHIETKGMVVSPEAQTIVKNRYIAQDQQLLRVDFEKTHSYEKETLKTLLKNTKELLKQCSVLILSDYGKGALPPQVIQTLLKEAQNQNKPSIVDPKGQDYSLYEGALFVTPNKKELREATNLPTETDEDVIRAAQTLIQRHGIQNVLATRSEKGMTLVQGNGDVTHFRAVSKEVYDVSGAGDTVVATLAAALGAGAPFEDAVQLANLAGMVVVGKVGTATVTLEDIEEVMAEQDRFEDSEKILTLPKAKKRVDQWKAKGLKVGFTNGCFDLLHQGHLKSLRESKAACDRLIIGLNTDASIKRLKGPNRPIQSQDTRAAVLEALSLVDLVVLFGDDTPIKPIETLLPDVLVKGSDYTIDQVVGADVVMKNGGHVHLVDLMAGHSTTNTVEKMKT